MPDLEIIDAVKGELLIQRFGDSDFVTFSSEDSYGNIRFYKAIELDPNAFYIVEYNRNKDTHPIKELNLISNQSKFEMWF